MKKMIVMVFCILIGGGQALAACVTTVTAITPTTDFIVHGSGTVTHSKTGLMWKQCPEGLSGVGCATGVAIFYTWQASLQLAETLNAAGGLAGFVDWRVPNIKELNSIVENQCFNPSINTTIFPNTASSVFWSASPIAGNAPYAWNVNFAEGTNPSNVKATSQYVRLVRGGQ